MPELEPVDLVVTSPPYDDLRTYEGYKFDFHQTAYGLYRLLKSGGVIVWVVADATKNGSESGNSFRQVLFFNAIGLNIHDTMIYKASGTGAKGSNLCYWQCFEYMFVLSKDKIKTVNRLKDKLNTTYGVKQTYSKKLEISGNNRQHRGEVTGKYGVRDNIWEYKTGMMNQDDKTEHPAPFPEALARDHILSWSNPGDTVFDPMAGSGTTLKMAENLNRKWLGCEISEKYCEIIAKRLEQETAQLKLFTC